MQRRKFPDVPEHHRRPRVTRPTRRWGAPVVVAAMILALVTACGGGSGGGGSNGPVVIGKAVDTIGFTTVDVARDKGYFRKQGVQAKEELLGGSSTAFAALQSGGVQFVTASSTALLSAKAKGVPIQAVASLDYGVSLQMIASNSWIKSHHLSTDQPLNTVMQGLKGATLGVISTTDLAYDHYLMKGAGVDPKDFKTISLKTQSAALAALQHGQIDAFLLSPPNSYHAESQGSAKVIATLHDVPQLKNMTYDILVVASDYAKSHPDTVKSVATSLAMADNTMATDPSSVLDVEKKHYPSMSDDVLRRSLEYVSFARNGQMTEDGWKDAQEQAAQTEGSGVSDVDITPGGGTWTNEFIKSADLTSAAP